MCKDLGSPPLQVKAKKISSLLLPYRQHNRHKQHILYGQAGEAHFWWVKSRGCPTDVCKNLSIPCQGRGIAAPLTSHSSSISNDFLQICLQNSSTATFRYGQTVQQDVLLPLLSEALSPGHQATQSLPVFSGLLHQMLFKLRLWGQEKKKKAASSA